jgi:hypothetical protein
VHGFDDAHGSEPGSSTQIDDEHAPVPIVIVFIRITGSARRRSFGDLESRLLFAPTLVVLLSSSDLVDDERR